MNLNSVLIGTEDPRPLVEYYTRLFGAPTGTANGYSWWQVGTGGFTIGEHSEVKGRNEMPGRMIWNIETADVKGEFDRLKAAGATIVKEPYAPGQPDDADEMLVATFEDPDGNYFQLVSPM
jgi:predicted enzyme related to lactoylglutathione lyase